MSNRYFMKKLLYRLIEWICCFDENQAHIENMFYSYRIFKVKGWNCFLVSKVTKQGEIFDRLTVCPIWNWDRVKHLLTRKITW